MAHRLESLATHLGVPSAAMGAALSPSSAATAPDTATGLDAAAAAAAAAAGGGGGRSPITSHVLDTTAGKPAQGMDLRLEMLVAPPSASAAASHPAAATPAGAWTCLGRATTNSDGRAPSLLPASHTLAPGHYRVTFDTGAYYARSATRTFFPSVTIDFCVEAGHTHEHYHVPLLISPFSYSTYRGS